MESQLSLTESPILLSFADGADKIKIPPIGW
jgi:hypothetical protein